MKATVAMPSPGNLPSPSILVSSNVCAIARGSSDARIHDVGSAAKDGVLQTIKRRVFSQVLSLCGHAGMANISPGIALPPGVSVQALQIVSMREVVGKFGKTCLPVEGKHCGVVVEGGVASKTIAM